jgi:hypothetical protein
MKNARSLPPDYRRTDSAYAHSILHFFQRSTPMDNGAISKSAKKRIVILGGGFGGVYAALHLEKLLAREPEVEICLVSRDNFFLFTPMLHEIAASDLEITRGARLPRVF